MTETWPRVDAGPLHRTQDFSALGFSFSVRTHEAAMARHLDELLRCLSTPVSAPHVYTVTARRALGATKGPYRIALDGEEIAAVTSSALALDHLLWHINRQVIERTDDLLLVHAGAVACSKGGIVLPAPSGSGKSTVVAGLVRTGMGYLTDEAVAIHPATLELRPYPKPLGLDRGSLQALANLHVPFRDAAVPDGSSECHVAPTTISAGNLASSCAPVLVIAPCYSPGPTNRVVPISRADALVLLVQSSFNLASFGPSGFLTLAQLVRQSACYRLEFADLAQACALVLDLVERSPQPPSQPRQ